jgi:putative FmdB family regulatory protein
MPIYEYQCKSCGKEIEVLQSTSDVEKHKCPGCGEGMERIMSSGGVKMGKSSSAPPPCAGGGCSTGTCPYN